MVVSLCRHPVCVTYCRFVSGQFVLLSAVEALTDSSLVCLKLLEYSACLLHGRSIRGKYQGGLVTLLLSKTKKQNNRSTAVLVSCFLSAGSVCRLVQVTAVIDLIDLKYNSASVMKCESDEV